MTLETIAPLSDADSGLGGDHVDRPSATPYLGTRSSLFLWPHLRQRVQGRLSCHSETARPWRCIWPRSHGPWQRCSCFPTHGQAGWHSSAKLEVPDNITIVLLPSTRPQLCVTTGLSTVFTTYHDILDRCCEAWLSIDPARSCPIACAIGPYKPTDPLLPVEGLSRAPLVPFSARDS